jgi:hypothetical protein
LAFFKTKTAKTGGWLRFFWLPIFFPGQRTRSKQLASPHLCCLFDLAISPLGGDGGSAGGEVPGVRDRAYSRRGCRGFHPLLGGPLPRRHDALPLCGGQAAPLQRNEQIPRPFYCFAVFSFATLGNVRILASWMRACSINSAMYRIEQICLIVSSACPCDHEM